MYQGNSPGPARNGGGPSLHAERGVSILKKHLFHEILGRSVFNNQSKQTNNNEIFHMSVIFCYEHRVDAF